MRREIKFGEAAEQYLAFIKTNRMEKTWKRRERILREDVLPAIGDLSMDEALETCVQSVLALKKDDKRASAAYDAVSTVINWKMTHL